MVNDDLQYIQNPLLKLGQEYMVCLSEEDDILMITGGPYGVFKISESGEQEFVQSNFDFGISMLKAKKSSGQCQAKCLTLSNS